MLNKRQERIISIFYENKEWITGKELARLLGVSDRTIRSDIDAINEISDYAAEGIGEGRFVQEVTE